MTTAKPPAGPRPDPDEGYDPPSDAHDSGSPAATPAVATAVPPRGPAAPSATGLEEPAGRRSSLRTFESFKEPAFRWYILASLGQFGAMNMQMLVRGIIVFQLTGSYAALGTVSLASAIPGLGLTMFGGVFADRFPKKRVVQAGQAVSALMALVVGLLLYFDVLQFWHLIVSSIVQGAVMALMMPSRQSMLPEVVGMERLMNATALNMGGMNVMRLAMPAAGGFLLVVMGAEYVYFLMTGFYLFSVVTLQKLPTVRAAAGIGARPGATPGMGAGGLRDIADGLAYIVRTRTLLVLLLSSLAIVLFSMPYQMMLPGYVLDVLGGGPQMVGGLTSIASVGSLSATVVLASLPSRNRGKLLLAGAMLMGVGLLAFSFATAVWAAAGMMMLIAVGQSVRMSLGNVLVQTYVEDEYRGRAMSVFMMQMNVAMFGAFVFGLIASVIGPQQTFAGMAIVLLALSSGLWLFVPRLRDLQ